MKIATIDSLHSHGGKIVSGSTTTKANGKPIARVDDVVSCPVHGMNKIISGSSLFRDDGLPVARVGDVTLCGAVIITGEDFWEITE